MREVKSTLTIRMANKERERKITVYKRYIRRFLNRLDILLDEECTFDGLVEIAAIHLASDAIAFGKYDEGMSKLIRESFFEGMSTQKTLQGRRAVRGKLKHDPKQKALKEIELNYIAQKNHFKRRGYSAQFIREMHSKFPIIESQKTIENLVSALNLKNKLIP